MLEQFKVQGVPSDHTKRERRVSAFTDIKKIKKNPIALENELSKVFPENSKNREKV